MPIAGALKMLDLWIFLKCLYMVSKVVQISLGPDTLVKGRELGSVIN